jgi:hypothetical protein
MTCIPILRESGENNVKIKGMKIVINYISMISNETKAFTGNAMMVSHASSRICIRVFNNDVAKNHVGIPRASTNVLVLLYHHDPLLPDGPNSCRGACNKKKK